MRRTNVVTLLGLAAAFAATALGSDAPSATHPAAKVVKTVALTGQSGAIPPTKLIAFKNNLYRVSMYYTMVSTTADCNTSISEELRWKDESNQERSRRIGPINECFNLDANEDVMVVHGLPGTDLKYTVLASPRDTINYSLYIAVEELPN